MSLKDINHSTKPLNFLSKMQVYNSKSESSLLMGLLSSILKFYNKMFFDQVAIIHVQSKFSGGLAGSKIF